MNAARRLEDEITNPGASPRGEHVPPPEEDANIEQDPVNTLPLTDEDIGVSLIQLAQASTVQAQAMMVQANRELVPRPHQQVTTMVFYLRDFIRMNPSTFYGFKVKEDPQEFIDEVYKILLAMVLSTSERSSWTLINSRTWPSIVCAMEI